MGSYVTLAEARAAGIPATVGDDVLSGLLAQKSQLIEQATKQWFEPRPLTMDLDGNHSRTLFLPIPIISVSALYINGDFTNVLDPKLYVVYNNNSFERDDRRNPMIKFASTGVGIFDVPDLARGMLFTEGSKNQRVVGVFGFVEPDGSTPDMIKRAVLRLTIKQIQQGPAGNGTIWDEILGGPAKQGNITSETTDGHSVTYNAFQFKPTKPGLNDIFNDPEVTSIVTMYRAPIKIASAIGSGGPDKRWR